MTTFREDMLAIADNLRSIAGPTDFDGFEGFDVRPYKLTIRTRIWADGFRSSSGRYTDHDLVIPQIYKMKVIATSEVASSGGRYEMGDIRVGPITPYYPGPPAGGFTEDQLKPRPTQNGTEIIYIIEGQGDGEFNLVSLDSMKTFGFFLTLRRSRKTP